jgi:Putative Ig domain
MRLGLGAARLLFTFLVLQGTFAAPDLRAAIDGTYDGTTGQGLSFSLVVSGNKITDITLAYATMCGDGGVHGTFNGGAGCPLTGTTFDCGATFCVFNLPSFRVVGAFFCSNVSGTIDLKRSDSVNCCTVSAIPFSASLPSGPPMMGIDPPTLPDGDVGTYYSAMCSAMGGTPPYHYDVPSGPLPNGLSLDADTGLIDGVPTTPGPFAFSIGVVDANYCITTRGYNVTISDPCATETQPPAVTAPAPATVTQSTCG